MDNREFYNLVYKFLMLRDKDLSTEESINHLKIKDLNLSSSRIEVIVFNDWLFATHYDLLKASFNKNEDAIAMVMNMAEAWNARSKFHELINQANNNFQNIISEN